MWALRASPSVGRLDRIEPGLEAADGLIDGSQEDQDRVDRAVHLRRHLDAQGLLRLLPGQGFNGVEEVRRPSHGQSHRNGHAVDCRQVLPVQGGTAELGRRGHDLQHLGLHQVQMTNSSVRPGTADDYDSWLPLWRGYQEFYEVDLRTHECGPRPLG